MGISSSSPSRRTPRSSAWSWARRRMASESTPPGAGFQESAEQDQSDDHGGRFEVQMAGAGGEQTGEDGGDEAVAIGGAGTDGDEGVHVGEAGAQGGPGRGVEAPTGPELHGGGEGEHDPGRDARRQEWEVLQEDKQNGGEGGVEQGPRQTRSVRRRAASARHPSRRRRAPRSRCRSRSRARSWGVSSVGSNSTLARSVAKLTAAVATPSVP